MRPSDTRFSSSRANRSTNRPFKALHDRIPYGSMFIEFMVVETTGVAQVVHKPKWPAIQSAIQGLDGIVKTMICLMKTNECRMDIGGGAHDRCVVSGTVDNEAYHMLIEAMRGKEPVKITVNGQINDYPAEVLVAKVSVLKAAKLFAEKGQWEPSVQWRSTVDAQG